MAHCLRASILAVETEMTEESDMVSPQPAPVEAAQEPTQLPLPTFNLPTLGEMITSSRTGTTFRMGPKMREGSFSFVFECTDDWDNELVAKVLKPHQPYEVIKGAALTEMTSLFQARHPFITYVHDAFEFRNTFYIVTERCTRTLSDMWKITPYQGDVWIRPIARCLLQALSFIHNMGMVHQDIHPGNVFLNIANDKITPKNRIVMDFKLGDLGLAKMAYEMNPANTFAQWMLPPEVIDTAQFGPVDYRVDIYHCGLLLLQILKGRDLQFTKEQTLDGSPRRMALELPPPYSAALEKTLRRHVMYRTASAKELWRDLNSPVSN
jgi:serine/threonine-protein kinase